MTSTEISTAETKTEKKRSSSVSFSVPIITISPAIVDDLLLPTPSPPPSPPRERDRSPKLDGEVKRSPPKKERATEKERERERERRATGAVEKTKREEAKELRVKRLLEVWELFRVRYLGVIAPVMK
eukprot:TRINITY_DN7471_c0_g1_i2.p2 TRINITY_DN7471_c0_g1~~TRINITY_DN7471_c0_g1_i2.p2  ORF type:complete len:127 (-),score=43.36 TRINITY_DN7471_c0_g1_i2:27-407(-)